MKIRSNFVANSSSSSFTIEKNKLTKFQIDLIIDHGYFAQFMDNIGYLEDEWLIEETDTHITGSTIMDNFDMVQYLENIGVLHLAKFEEDDYR